MQVRTLTSTTEPAVGDKRPREDDVNDADASAPPATRQASTNNHIANTNHSQMQGQQNSPGNATQNQINTASNEYSNFPPLATMQAMAGMVTGTGMMAAAAGTGTNDSLYIGDLQWVCTALSSLRCCACCTENTTLVSSFFHF